MITLDITWWFINAFGLIVGLIVGFVFAIVCCIIFFKDKNKELDRREAKIDDKESWLNSHERNLERKRISLAGQERDLMIRENRINSKSSVSELLESTIPFRYEDYEETAAKDSMKSYYLGHEE